MWPPVLIGFTPANLSCCDHGASGAELCLESRTFMDDSKSCLGFYLGLVSELYRDIAQCYGVPLRMQRTELGLLQARCAKEGISFLTKSLPRFGKAVDSALSSGILLSISGFKLAPNSVIPLFLGWLLSKVFDASGKELDQPDPIALKHFRQLCNLYYKLEMPYDKETEESVISSFVATDTELAVYNDGPSPDIISGGVIDGDQPGGWNDEWIVQARALVCRAVSGLDPQRIEPRHGPGAVATREDVCQKTNFSRIYANLEVTYPFSEWFHFSLTHVADSIHDWDRRVTLVDQATAKVVLVPKDSRGPRLISCEPLEIQWIQQGLGRLLVDRLESSKLTKGFVNFTDQNVNRRLAILGSSGEGWVTLDMKDASDRVSLELVKTLFQDHPKLLEALLACRSSQTQLPNGRVVSLNKFAPMGSALCFPVEALVFWALSVSAIKRSRRITWREATSSVYVYGDDIIVREQDYATLLQTLPRVGLKFNGSKCCVARFFRESCGCDAYVGVNVTPSRLKTMWSRRRSNDPKSLASYVAFSNAMYGMGHFLTADYVRKAIIEVWGPIPYTNTFTTAGNSGFETDFDKAWKNQSLSTQSPAIAFACNEPATQLNSGFRKRTTDNNPRYHYGRLEYQVHVSRPLKVKTPYDGWAEMLRRHSGGYGSHGGSYAITRRNRLKRVWTEV